MSELSKVLYRCRRGTKELDMLTQHYAREYYSSASRSERDRFMELLDLQDPILYHVLVEQDAFDDPLLASIVDKIRAHSCGL